MQAAALVGVELAALGETLLLALHVGLVDLHALGAGQGLEREVELDPLHGALAALAADLLQGLPRVLQEALQLQAGAGQLDLHLGELVVDLAVDERLGDVDGHPVAQRLEHLGLVALLVLALGDLAEALAVVGAQLLDGLTVAVELGQGVVQRRQVALADLLDGDLDVDRLPAQLLAREVLREGDARRLGVARLHADERIGEAGEKALAVDLDVALLLVLADHLVAPAHGQGGAQHVAVLGGAVLDADQVGVAAAQLLDDLVDPLLGDLRLLLGDAQLLQVAAQLHLGKHGHGGREAEGLAALEVAELDLGLADRLDLLLVERVGVHPRQQGVDRLLLDRLPADHPLHDLGRRLAGAEAGDAHPAAEAADGVGDRLVDLRSGRLDAQLDEGAGLALDADGQLRGGGGCAHWAPGVWARRARTETRTRTGC